MYKRSFLDKKMIVNPGKTFYFCEAQLRPIRWPAREWKASRAWRPSSCMETSRECHGNLTWVLEDSQRCYTTSMQCLLKISIDIRQI